VRKKRAPQDDNEKEASANSAPDSAPSAVQDVDVFRVLVKAGTRLADIHVHYESQPEYQVSTDKRSGITNDPNCPDDRQYILRLIGQVITVSLETVKIVASLPRLGLPESQIPTQN